MRNPLCCIPALIFILWLGLNQLHGQSNIATIDLQKVFDGYWKTQKANLNLKQSDSEYRDLRGQYLAEFKQVGEEYLKLIELANDPAVSAEEKQRQQQNADAKKRQIKELEDRIRKFDQSNRTVLAEQQRRMRENLLTEIQGVVTSKARVAGYALVLNTAALSITKAPIVVFSNGERDMTDQILTHLNADAPTTLVRPDQP